MQHSDHLNNKKILKIPIISLNLKKFEYIVLYHNIYSLAGGAGGLKALNAGEVMDGADTKLLFILLLN